MMWPPIWMLVPYVLFAADVDGALAALQWVLSARPDAAVAEQHLQAALKLVSADWGVTLSC